MDIKSKVNEGLSKLLFLQLKKNNYLGEYYIKEDIYAPIKATTIIEKINKGEKVDNIPVSAFIEGMCYVLGADEEFRFKNEYIEILNTLNGSVDFIKNRIFMEVKDKKYEEAYIFIKGLLKIENSEEVYNKAFLLLQELISLDEDYREEEFYIIDSAKNIPNYSLPYFYEAMAYRDVKEFEKALVSIHTYLEKGGKETEEVIELKENLISINQFNKGKKLSTENPEEALKYLIPLIDYYGETANIYYYIAVSYRNLGNFEKAIYYLNEAATIDDALIEVLNEYGINYASLGEFNRAVDYFEKAFEACKNIEICTNIVMCYINLKNIEKAKEYMEKAIKLDEQDEIVKELITYFNNIDIQI
ncbi:tetratricopeptide repeat protein [Hathewaya histolytica]|uniref:TPR repeats containing protein n=1 Tax=Hathewaya histolytica TaxID=1498 RepID=A0A4U9RMT5_HATHI|nr:tetratricopeptide repeat protein [Hathewaya histolytica]VTQ92798.1 TPR repeats containing protein [Hathewaya histolytica]